MTQVFTQHSLQACVTVLLRCLKSSILVTVIFMRYIVLMARRYRFIHQIIEGNLTVFSDGNDIVTGILCSWCPHWSHARVDSEWLRTAKTDIFDGRCLTNSIHKGLILACELALLEFIYETRRLQHGDILRLIIWWNKCLFHIRFHFRGEPAAVTLVSVGSERHVHWVRDWLLRHEGIVRLIILLGSHVVEHLAVVLIELLGFIT